MERRDFLGAVTAALGAGLSGAEGVSAMTTRLTGGARRPTLPDAWGVQLYTLRSLLSQDVPGTLRAVAELGYGEVELAGLHGWEPGAMRRLLEVLDLRAVSSHVGIDLLREDAQAALDEAAALGVEYAVVPWLAPDERSADGFRALADELNRLGDAARAAGLRLGYHNHDFELAALDDGPDGHGLHLLLENTDPELVTFQLDLFWVAHAGADALHIFRDHPGRFTSVHAKDRTREGEMVAVGQGTLDFATLLAAGEAAGVRHVFVEHDRPADPMGSISQSIEHLNGLRGG